jgi:hypothetical protein
VPRAVDVQRAVEPVGEALERELAVARLGPRILRDGGHARARARTHASLLFVGQRRRRVDVEDGLDPRGGHVGVLTAGAGRATRAELDLLEWDRDAAREPEQSYSLSAGWSDLPLIDSIL